MKKILSVTLLATVLIFATCQVEAAGYGEVYVGSYSDGTEVYLMTNTIQKRDWAHAGGYSCRVRAGRDYLDYEFWTGGGYSAWKYRNSEGYEGKVYDGSSPVAAAILDYIRR